MPPMSVKWMTPAAPTVGEGLAGRVPLGANVRARHPPHCDSTSAAYRRLAQRWLAILGKLGPARQTYDEDDHLQPRAARRTPRP